jgi:hypothetical protein
LIPSIFELTDNNRIKLTPECFVIPELKYIIDQYEDKAEPYLLYAWYLTNPSSPYCNLSDGEKVEELTSDIFNTVGEFNEDCPLLIAAIEKLKLLQKTPIQSFFEEIRNDLTRMKEYLRATPITGGKDGDLKDRIGMLEKVGKMAEQYKSLEKLADQERQEAMRGGHEMGLY